MAKTETPNKKVRVVITGGVLDSPVVLWCSECEITKKRNGETSFKAVGIEVMDADVIDAEFEAIIEHKLLNQ